MAARRGFLHLFEASAGRSSFCSSLFPFFSSFSSLLHSRVGLWFVSGLLNVLEEKRRKTTKKKKRRKHAQKAGTTRHWGRLHARRCGHRLLQNVSPVPKRSKEEETRYLLPTTTALFIWTVWKCVLFHRDVCFLFGSCKGKTLYFFVIVLFYMKCIGIMLLVLQNKNCFELHQLFYLFSIFDFKSKRRK